MGPNGEDDLHVYVMFPLVDKYRIEFHGWGWSCSFFVLGMALITYILNVGFSKHQFLYLVKVKVIIWCVLMLLLLLYRMSLGFHRCSSLWKLYKHICIADFYNCCSELFLSHFISSYYACALVKLYVWGRPFDIDNRSCFCWQVSRSKFVLWILV